MGPKVRLGMVGLGHVADHQIRALQELPEKFAIASVCDRNPDAASKVARVPFFAEVADMLARDGLDAVLVSVPLSDHFPVAQAVLSAGLPVLLEKPATESVDQFIELGRLADHGGVLLHTAFHARFARELVWYLEEQARLEASLGPVTGVHCGFYDPYVVDGVLVAAAASLGGSWVDSGINALSVVLRLLRAIAPQELRRTSVAALPCREIQGSLDFAFSAVDAGHGGTGLIDTNWTLGLSRKTTRLFFGTTGCQIILDHSRQQARLLERGGEVRVLADFAHERSRLLAHYVGVFEDFYDCLREGRDNRERSLELLRLLYLSPEPHA